MKEELICNGTSAVDQLSNVSPLYGVGTVTGWHLTILGLFMTWTFDPEKGQHDSISADLIVVITLPLVAMSHLVRLTHPQTSWRLQQGSYTSAPWDESRQKDQLAAVAPYLILLYWQRWSLPLLATRYLYRNGSKRPILIWGMELLCFQVVSAYGFLFSAKLKCKYPNPDGSEPIRTTWSLVWLIICPVVFMLRCAYNRWWSNANTEDVRLELWAAAVTFSLCWTWVLVGSTPTIRSAQDCPSQGYHLLRRFFLPYSNSSFTDLDQAVALAAGATSLMTRCWSIVSLRWKRWLDRSHRPSLLKADSDTKEEPDYMERENTVTRNTWTSSGAQNTGLGTILPTKPRKSTEKHRRLISWVQAAQNHHKLERDTQDIGLQKIIPVDSQIYAEEPQYAMSGALLASSDDDSDPDTQSAETGAAMPAESRISTGEFRTMRSEALVNQSNIERKPDNQHFPSSQSHTL